MSQDFNAGDNSLPVVSVDYRKHTRERPFCLGYPTCPCHGDYEKIRKVNEHVRNGLLTEEEARRTIKGEMF